MNQYEITKARVFQWVIILLILLGGTGTYFYLRSRAAQTVTDNTPSFEAPLTTTLDLARGIGGPTFSRADGADRRATVTDFEGLIRPVKNGEARFEGARRVENLFTYSEAFQNAAWGKYGTGTIATATDNNTTAPDGTTTGALLDVSGASDDRIAQSKASFPIGTYIFSIWLKQAGAGGTVYIISSGTGTGGALVTPTATWKRFSIVVTVSTIGAFNIYPINRSSGGTATSVYAWHPQLEDVTGQSNQNPSEYVSTNVKTASPYHGANVDGVKYFATQNGNTVASNIVTEATGTAIPDATLKGYLAEGARTNLATYSEQLDNASWVKVRGSVTANAVVSPSGQLTADKFIEDTTVTNTHSVSQVVTKTASNLSYAISVYAKAGERSKLLLQGSNGANGVLAVFDVSAGTISQSIATFGTGFTAGTATIQSVGSGWYRCSITLTSDTGTSLAFLNRLHNGATDTYTGDGTSGLYLWGAQLEQASFASSYIPTTTASVTRGADSLKYIGASNFNDATGTIAVDVTPNWSGGSGLTAVFTDDSAADQRTALWHWSGTNNSLIVDRNGGGGTRNNFDYSGSTITAGTQMRLAQRWSDTANSLFRDGSLRGSDTTLTLPYDSMSGISVGRNGLYAGMEAYSTIKNVRAWKKALTDTQLQNITSATNAISLSGTQQSTLLNTGESLRADLTSTLDLQAGVGGPTFSRTDGADRRATVTDFEGLIKPVKNGEARFEGARRVENNFSYPENFSHASWSVSGSGSAKTPNYSAAPDGSTTAGRVQIGASGDFRTSGSGFVSVLPVNGVTVSSFWVKATSSNSTFRISHYNSAAGPQLSSDIIATNTWQKVSFIFDNSTIGGNGYTQYWMIVNGSANAAVDILIWHPQLEDATGQSNQNPSEYVSVRVKTVSPYHGANVDGVKYFATQNGNTVSSNIITEATSTAIPDATLKGYLAEGTRTNLELYSEDMSNWTTNVNVTLLADNTVAPDGKMTADKLTGVSSAPDGKLKGVTLSANTAYTLSGFFKQDTSLLSRFGLWDVTGGDWQGYLDIAWSSGVPSTSASSGASNITYTQYTNGWWRVSLTCTSDTVNTSHQFHIHPDRNNTQKGIWVWGAQLEAGAFASSYIPTTTTSVTRGIDSLSYLISNMEATIGSAYLEFTPHWSTKLTGEPYEEAKLISLGTDPERIIAVEGTQMDMYDGSSPAYSAPTYAIDVLGRYAGRWGGGSKRLYRNGIAGTNVTFDGSFSVSPGPLIISKNGKSFGNIKNVRIWKKVLTDVQLQNLTSTNDAVSRSAIQKTTLNVNQNSQSTNGLVGLWSFNGPDISGTTAYDRSGSGNNGTLTNGPIVTEGKVGQALSFDGVDDYVSIGTKSAYDVGIGQAMTLSSWVKAGTQSANNMFLWKAGSCIGWFIRLNATGEITLVLTTGNNGCTGYNTYALTSPAATTYKDNAWHHVVAVIDRPNLIMRLYIDGSSVGTPVAIDNTYNSNTNPDMRIGTSWDNSASFAGSIDEVRIYNRALSASEVAALYNMGR